MPENGSSDSPRVALERRVAVAVRGRLRAELPDFLLASWFLPRRQRDDLHTLAALALPLAEITGLSASASTPADGACACGEDSAAGRAQTAHNVIDYLYHDEQAGRSGRPEFDAAVGVVARLALPERLWHSLIDAMAHLAEQRRIATPEAQVESLQEVAAPLTGLAAASLGLDDAQGRARLQEFISALALLRQMLLTRVTWRRSQRLTIPLADLHDLGWRDREITAWLDDPIASPLDAGRLALLRARMTTRAEEALGRARGVLDVASPATARACCAAAGAVTAAWNRLESEPALFVADAGLLFRGGRVRTVLGSLRIDRQLFALNSKGRPRS